MAKSAGYRNPDYKILNFSYEKNDDCHLTALVHSVRFHVTVEGKKLQAESGPGAKIGRHYRDLLAAVKSADNDFTRPSSLSSLRTRKSSKEKEENSPSASDNDSAVDVKGPQDQSSPLLENGDPDPSGTLTSWLLKPFGPTFQDKAPPSKRRTGQNLEEWYSGPTLFYSLSLNEEGSFAATEEEATAELEHRQAGTIPKMYVPKWIRQLDVPWYPAKDAIVLRESDEIAPFRPSQVRIGNENFFLKMVDPTQPTMTRREIGSLKQIENKGLHKQFRVPLIKGLLGFEKSKTEMMGFIMTEIEDPTPLTQLLDEEVPQKKRGAWAKESERIVNILHENELVWGDAKADNFMVDKHDNLWIIDFGGSYTDGWVDQDLMETEAGDDMGLGRIVNALHDPQANTFDPAQGASPAEASPGKKRKAEEVDKTSVHKSDESGNESSPRKRARKEQSTESKAGDDDEEAEEPPRSEKSLEEAADADDLNDDGDDEQFCYCKKPSSGDMIFCEGDNCERQWFHFECVGLKSAPETKHWHCDDCREDAS